MAVNYVSQSFRGRKRYTHSIHQNSAAKKATLSILCVLTQRVLVTQIPFSGGTRVEVGLQDAMHLGSEHG